MNTSESTNSVYRALCDAGVEHTVAHNACEQMLNLAGRNITDHIDSRFDAVNSRFDAVNSRFDAVNSRFATLEKDIAQLGETVKKDIAHLNGYLKWLIPFHCALVVGILATLVVNMFR